MRVFTPSPQRFLTVLLTFGLCALAHAGDWTTYRGGISRNAIVDEALPADLRQAWVHTPAHPPKPAWPMPSEELPRMHDDSAYHVAVGDGQVYFGSPVTGRVDALNSATGRRAWSYYTDGPVRFTPTYADGRLYFGSDDGYVYCLRAKDGEFVWKFRPGPSDERVIGNGQMISLWPVRTSVIVDNGQVLCSAGVFPYEGLYVCALDPEDGSVLWRNDTVGDRGHELDFGGISPHGYLVASEDILYVPSARAMPAAFDRANGEFLFFASTYGKSGGTWTLLAGGKLFAGTDASGEATKFVYDAKTGEKIQDKMDSLAAIDVVVQDKTFFAANNSGVSRLEQNADEEGLKTQWKLRVKGASSLLLTGGLLIAGANNLVVAMDPSTGEEAWRHEIQGKAVGLAAADGRLWVSTDAGPIYCFAEYSSNIIIPPAPSVRIQPSAAQRALAKQILDDAGIRKGWCLVTDWDAPELLAALAEQSDLKLVAIEHDPAKRAAARKQLDSAKLLGTRIIVQDWAIDDLPMYFANLIVSEDSLASAGKLDEAVGRVLRPYGGTAYWNVAKNTQLASAKFVRGALEGAGSWTQQYANPENTACSEDELVSGALGMLWFGEPGPQGMVERHARAASPVALDGRFFIQGEERIYAVDSYNGTLLWEREIPGAVRTMVKNDSGNLVLGNDGLYVAAADACYRLDPATGETTKTYELPPSARGRNQRWGYISLRNGILYGSAAAPLKLSYGGIVDLLTKDGAWRDDSEIPEKYVAVCKTYREQYPVPNEDFVRMLQRRGGLWAPMLPRPRGGEFTQKSALTENVILSDTIFALDVETGELLWEYCGEGIAAITVTLGGGNIYFADLDVSDEERQAAYDKRKEQAKTGQYTERASILEALSVWEAHRDEDNTGDFDEREVKYMIESLRAEMLQVEHSKGTLAIDDLDVRRVIAMNATTGEQCWEQVMDLTGCGGDGLGTAYHNDRLMISANWGNHDAWRFKLGGMDWRRISMLSADDGELVWSRPMNYRTRPLIVGDRIIIEPRAADFDTGEIITREHPITGAAVAWEFLRPGHTCGLTSASAKGIFYRSSSMAFYDLEKDNGVALFGGYRPGCAISVVPASGVLLSAEAGAGCTCSYPVKCSFAMVRKPGRTQPWTVFVTPEDAGPVRRFAINLGAPADMKDDDGVVWFGYPNPDTNYAKNHYPDYGVKFDLQDRVAPEGGYYATDHKGKQIEGTDKPWLFTSGCEGFLACEIPLAPESAEAAQGRYTVRLGFMARPKDGTGRRVFDIKLQDKAVLNDFDLVKAAKGTGRAIVREFKGIRAGRSLRIELTSNSSASAPDAAPILSFIEVIREDIS